MRFGMSAAVAAALLAGCGSSKSSSSGTLAGNVFGQPFTPVEVAFVGPADATCSTSFSGTTVSYAESAMLIAFASSPGLCALATDTCAGRKNFTLVAGAVAHAKLSSGTPPGLQTGAYTVYANVATAVPDATGDLRAAVLNPITSDAVCHQTDGGSGSGTIQLDAIGPTEVRGSIDVTFPGGGFLKGPFVAASCAATFDVCSANVAACTGTPTCT